MIREHVWRRLFSFFLLRVPRHEESNGIDLSRVSRSPKHEQAEFVRKLWKSINATTTKIHIDVAETTIYNVDGDRVAFILVAHCPPDMHRLAVSATLKYFERSGLPLTEERSGSLE